ncbi:hypothetical protein EON67_09670 [archaeon]|nr:MAG: hypothetical protein EON67_09670 [archaeon]
MRTASRPACVTRAAYEKSCQFFRKIGKGEPLSVSETELRKQVRALAAQVFTPEDVELVLSEIASRRFELPQL